MVAKCLSTSLILWSLLFLITPKLWGAEIVGRILDAETSQGVVHAIVRAMPQQKNRREVQVETNEDGRYALELLRGKYRLFVSVPESNYRSRFYSSTGREQGDFIDVPTFESFIIINVPLTSGGSISGSVRRVIDNLPIGNLRVYAEAPNFRVSVNSNRDGSYIFRALPPNDYRIHVLPLDENYISVYFDNVLDSRYAELIHLERRQEVTGIDFRLRFGGAISGRVFARKNREPIPGLEVIVEKQNSQEPPLFTYTDAQGFYALHGLSDGQYTVETGTQRDANPETRSRKRFLTQYYHGRLDRELAEKVTVESGTSVTGVEFSLVEGGMITGTVRSRYNGSPISGIEILPQDISRTVLHPPKGKTNTAGRYVIEDLAPGEYILDTSLPKNSQRFVKVFYRDKLSPERADKITVDEDARIRAIDFNLTLGATLKGRLKADEPDYKFNPAGDSLVLKRVDADIEGFGEKNFKPNSDGSFTIEGTAPGRYSLFPKITDPNVLPQENPAGKVLDVVEAEVVEGVDFALKIGGSISGTVSTQSDFYRLDKLLLILISVKENTKTYFDLTTEHYSIAGVQPGKYVLILLSNPEKTHPKEVLQPTRVFDTRLIEVFKGRTTRNIDFQIANSVEKQPGLLP
jgi:hypothetical protein